MTDTQTFTPYKPQAVLPTSNFGGVSIMLDETNGEYIFYKWYDEPPVRTELLWGEIDDSEEIEPHFLIGGTVYALNEFMKVGY